MSGLGKGITASSIAVLLQGCGWKVPPPSVKRLQLNILLVWQNPDLHQQGAPHYSSYKSGNYSIKMLSGLGLEGQHQQGRRPAGLGPDALVSHHAASPLLLHQTQPSCRSGRSLKFVVCS